MPLTSIYFSNPVAAAHWGVSENALRKEALRKGSFRGVPAHKLSNGRWAWRRDQVLASLGRADLDEGRRDAIEALERCTGLLSLPVADFERLCDAVYQVPHRDRHSPDRAVAQFDLALRTLQAGCHAELTGRRSADGRITSLTPATQRELAKQLNEIISWATHQRDSLLRAADRGGSW